jgi:hypothetical protein
MACGVPQIVSDWSGYRELVDHGVTGFRAQTIWAQCDDSIAVDGPTYPGDFLFDHFKLGQSVVVDLKSAVEWMALLASNEQLRQAMSAESRKRAVSEYSYAIMVSRYANLFREVSNQAKSSRECFDRSYAYKVPAYYKCFSADATTELASSAVLRVDKQRADVVLNAPMPCRALFSLDPYDGWNLPRIIEVVSQAACGITVGDLTKEVSSDVEQETAMRQILWLLKYGCVTRDACAEGEAKEVVLEQTRREAGEMRSTGAVA